MPALIVDDTPILGDKGDVFDVDDDFDAPDGTRYVSDIHNVAAKPQKRVCVHAGKKAGVRVVRPRARAAQKCPNLGPASPAGEQGAARRGPWAPRRRRRRLLHLQ